MATTTIPRRGLETSNSQTSRSGVAATAERALLVSLRLPRDDAYDDAAEFALLARSAGVQVCGSISGRCRRIDPATFVGQGKAAEVREIVACEGVTVVLVNHLLSPVQERNLEKAVGCRVLDRTGLILDIFAQRAHSHEGKLQVELAQLEHLSTRLVRGWTHLERQKGGIGLRGPGETQLETDRRLLRARIKKLHRRLEKVRNQRNIRRKSRHKIPIPTVSLVGYTNAGKSSLFNCLTGAEIFEADQLFATLDPTMRRLSLAGNADVILADTVGFIRRLPHDLIEAFKATLEEVAEADLLLHVVDSSNPERHDAMTRVNQVLTEIGADTLPQIIVFNKIDLVEQAPRMERNANGAITKVWLSARTANGVDFLKQALSEHFRSHRVRRRLQLPANGGRLRALVHKHLDVLAESATDVGGWQIDVALEPTQVMWLQKQAGFRSEYWMTDSGLVLAPTGS